MYSPSEELLKLTRQLFDSACSPHQEGSGKEYFELSIRMLKNDIERADIARKAQTLNTPSRIILPPLENVLPTPIEPNVEGGKRKRSTSHYVEETEEDEEEEDNGSPIIHPVPRGPGRPRIRPPGTRNEIPIQSGVAMTSQQRKVLPQKWTTEEKNLLMSLVDQYEDQRSPDWDEIAKKFPTRTKAAIRQEYSVIRKSAESPSK